MDRQFKWDFRRRQNRVPSVRFYPLGAPTFADAILDRIVHNAHRLELNGPSLRKTLAEQNSHATIDQPAENDNKGSPNDVDHAAQIEPGPK